MNRLCCFFIIGIILLPLELGASEFSVTAYNVGLAYGYVPLAKERKPRILDALREQDSDIICLQEVLEPDVDDFTEALKVEYPYHYRVPPEQRYADRTPACGVFDLFGKGRFVSCIIDKCFGKKGDELTDCVTSMCGESFEGLNERNRECVAAVTAQVGQGIFRSLWAVMNPFFKAPLRIYGGGNGLLLFSKYPLQDKDFQRYTDSTLEYRIALYSKVGDADDEHHVICTHLTPNFDGIVPYTGSSGSWTAENLSQTEELIEFIERKAGGRSKIVAGDFNHGARDEKMGLDGELERNYRIWSEHGYSDPAAEQRVGCSWCGDENNLIVTESEKNNRLIDHVFLKGASAEDVKAKILFEDPVEVSGEDGSEVQTHLSDHYGVNVLLTIE